MIVRRAVGIRNACQRTLEVAACRSVSCLSPFVAAASTSWRDAAALPVSPMLGGACSVQVSLQALSVEPDRPGALSCRHRLPWPT